MDGVTYSVLFCTWQFLKAPMVFLSNRLSLSPRRVFFFLHILWLCFLGSTHTWPVRTLYLHKDQENDRGFDPMWSLTKKQTSCLKIVSFYPSCSTGYLGAGKLSFPAWSLECSKRSWLYPTRSWKIVMHPTTHLPELMLR